MDSRQQKDIPTNSANTPAPPPSDEQRIVDGKEFLKRMGKNMKQAKYLCLATEVLAASSKASRAP